MSGPQERPETSAAPPSGIARFGFFELDLAKLELKRRGRPITLQQQPMVLLAYLVARAGTVLGREELQEVLWPDGTFVEYEFGIYSAINRLRRELGDSAAQPQFIETVPKKGYRFIAHVDFDTSLSEKEPAPPVAMLTEMPVDPLPVTLQKRVVPLWLWRAAAAFICLLLILAAWLIGKNGATSKRNPDQVYRFAIPLPPGQTVFSLAISPIGDRIVYQAVVHGRHTLYVRYLNENFSREIAGSDDGRAPFFSPNGQEIGFYTRGKLNVASPAGVRLVTAISPDIDQWNAIWASDGYIYFNALIGQYEGIWRVRPTAGKPEPLVRMTVTDQGASYPFVNQVTSTGSGNMIFSVVLGPNRRSLHVMNLQTRAIHDLVARGVGGEIVEGRHLLYFYKNSLYAAPIDRDRVQLRGAAVEALRDVAPYLWMRGKLAVSTNGTLAYVTMPELPGYEIDWIDRRGGIKRVPVPIAAYEQAELSPDGQKLAVIRREEPFRWGLWIYDLDTTAWTLLMNSGVPSPRVVWSPDGRSVIAGSEKENADFVNLVRISLDTPGKAERLTNQPNYGQFPQAWSAKGSAVLFLEGVHPKTGSDLMLLSLGGEQKSHPLVTAPGWKRAATFSPDGNFFAYETGHQDRPELFIQKYDAVRRQTVGPPFAIETNGGHDPLWAPDGVHLFYLNAQNDLLRLDFRRPAKPAELWIPHVPAFEGDWWARRYSMAPDGRLLIVRPTASAPGKSAEIQVVVNWFAELNRLVEGSSR